MSNVPQGGCACCGPAADSTNPGAVTGSTERVRAATPAAAFERLGYTDVRIYPGSKTDWLEAGLPLAGTRAGAVA